MGLRGFDGSSINNDNLNGTRAIVSIMLISLALITFSSGTNLEKISSGVFDYVVPFNALGLNIVLMWGWMGTRPIRLGR